MHHNAVLCGTGLIDIPFLCNGKVLFRNVWKKTQEKKHSNKNTEKKTQEKKTQSICKKYLSTYNKSNMASI